MSYMTILNKARTEAVTEHKLSAFENIPKGSVVTQVCTGAEWKEYEGVQYINLQWELQAPEQLKGRKQFQSLKVYNGKDFPVEMLMAIYYQALQKPYPHADLPNSSQLAEDLRFCKVNATYDEWDFDGKSGNWISGIAKADEAGAFINTPKTASTPQQPAQPSFDDVNDDIPF